MTADNMNSDPVLYIVIQQDGNIRLIRPVFRDRKNTDEDFAMSDPRYRRKPDGEGNA